MVRRKKGRGGSPRRESRGGAERRRRSPRSVPADVLRAVLIIVALAVVVRVAYMAEVADHPLMTTTTGDPKVYDLRALEIASGKWLADDVFFHSSPVYPYILGITYRLFGHSYAAVRVIQSLFGIGSCLLIFSLARRLFGEREAIIAGVISALYVPFVFFDSEILMITYVIFFTLLSLRLLLSWADAPRAWLALASGGALGVSALGKPNLLLFVPAAVVWLLLALRWGGGAGRTSVGAAGGASRTSWKAAALFVAGTVVVIAPMTVSNYVISGEFVLTSSNGGINFWIGNNEQADGTFLVPADMRADLYGGSKLAAEEAEGRRLGPAEVSAYWFRRGFEFIRRHPAQELKLLGRKFLLFWNAYEIPNHYDLNYFRTVSKTLRWDPFVFAWVVPVGVLGVYVSLKEWKKHLLLHLFTGAYLLSLMPFFITSRYRLPVVPVMILFCARGLRWLWSRIAARERLGWFAPSLVLAAAFVVVNLPLADFSLGPQYAIIAAVYRDRGDYPNAVKYYRMATKESPEFDLAYNSLGSSLSRMGRTAEAERALLRAIEINPHLASAYSNLGLVYLQVGRTADAREKLLTAVREDPNLKPAWENLARLGIMTQDVPLAVEALEEVLRIDPNDGYAHYNLAILYGADPERIEDALRHARAAAALEPALRSDAGGLIQSLTAGGTPPGS